MKKSGILVSLLLGTLALTSCGKSSSSAPAAPSIVTPPQQSKIELPVPANHAVKPISLRTAEAFALLAAGGITSVPTSAVTGKVGVRPATRADLKLTAEEVTGGVADTYAADDKDTAAVSLVTTAKVDLINAYNEAEERAADADKVDLFGGALGNKVLPAGVYKWNSRVTIPNDLTLEGTETDVFVFKVAGDLRVGSDVTIKLSGGALAKNVFWQVGDNLLVKAKSVVVGTVMAQGSVELREQSRVDGRVFSKNDKISMDKVTVVKPE
jgi:hypothetical protein